MSPPLWASITILPDSILINFFHFERDLNCVYLRKNKREREEEGPKPLVLPFTRVLKTNPSKIALVIYQSTVIPIISLFSLSASNKICHLCMLFSFLYSPFAEIMHRSIKYGDLAALFMHLLGRWVESKSFSEIFGRLLELLVGKQRE
jgi:hypothetical protein